MERTLENHIGACHIAPPDVSNIFKPFEITSSEKCTTNRFSRVAISKHGCVLECVLVLATMADKHPANRHLQKSGCCNMRQRRELDRAYNTLCSRLSLKVLAISIPSKSNNTAFTRSLKRKIFIKFFFLLFMTFF